jgi:microcystin-dependent protein
MQMWMIDGAAPAGYLLCHGQEVSQAIFPTLFAAISTTFNIGTEAAGNFRLPNLRQRSPLGKALSGTGSGWGSINGTGGIIDHDHTTASHVHGIPHTHAVPGHYHQMGNGSTLNITNSAKTSASAGTHVHSLTSVTTNAGEGNHTHTNNFFSGNISFTDINHSHTGTATSLGSAHRHTIPNRSIDAPAGTFPADFRPHIRPNVHHLLRGGNNLEGGATGSDLFGQDEGSHTHTLNIAPVGTFFHTHALGSLNITSSGAHAHGLTGTTDSTPNHSHAIDHSHGANEFTGSIGFRNGLVDGDSNFNSGQPNNANSSASTPVSTTTNNSPFHTVHFIIKT